MDIFLSYAREDAEAASTIAAILEHAGWSVWWDRRIPAGRRYEDVIQDALDGARAVVVLWTEASIRSDWVRAEADEGASRNVLVPVLLGTVRPPLGLRRLQAVDLAGKPIHPTCPGVHHLIDALRSILTTANDRPLHIPLPSALSGRGDIFIGRTWELDLLHSSLRSVRAGDRLLVVISGEPGLGKTRLASEFARGAAEDSTIILLGRSTEEMLVPYQPFVESLAYLVSQVPADRLAGLVSSSGAELTKLVPSLSRRVPNSPTISGGVSGERYRLFDAVATFLVHVGSEAPIVLILDDAQWADDPTLHLLRYLFSTDDRCRLLVIATYRHTELARRHSFEQLLADLDRNRAVRRVPLQGLSEREVAQLLTAHGAAPDSPEDARVARERTGGNPFFVEELARAAGGSACESPVTSSTHPTALPDELMGAIGQRIDRLSDECQRMLRIAAVMGRDFEIGVLERVSDLEEERLLDVLDEARAAGLVRESEGQSDGYVFVHELVREVISAQLSASRRARLHTRIGSALEEMFGSGDERIEERAHHFYEGTRGGDVTRAIAYARRAARMAEGQFAYEQAAEHYRRAIQLCGDRQNPRVRCELLIPMAWAQTRAASSEAQNTWERAVSEARLTDDSILFASAALGRAGVYSPITTSSDHMSAILGEALERLPPEDSSTRASVLARLAQHLRYHPTDDRAPSLSLEAEAMARRLGDSMTLAETVRVAHLVRWMSYTRAEHLAAADEIIRLADPQTLPELASWGRLSRLTALLRSGQMDLFTTARLEHLEFAVAYRHPWFRWQAAYVEAAACLASDRWSDAGRLADHAAQYGHRIELHLTNDVDAVLEVQRFEFALLMSETGEALAVATPFLGIEALKVARAQAAVAYARRGETSLARRLVSELGTDHFSALRRDFLFLYTLALLCEACWLLRDRTWADDLYSALEPYADEGIVVGVASAYRGSVARYLGLVAALRKASNEAESWLRQAIQFDQRTKAVAWELTAMADLAEVYRAQHTSEAERAEGNLLAELRGRLVKHDIPAITARLPK